MKQQYIIGQVYELKDYCQSCYGKDGNGEKKAKYIGIQQGVSFDLHLFNCESCQTTRSITIKKK